MKLPVYFDKTYLYEKEKIGGIICILSEKFSTKETEANIYRQYICILNSPNWTDGLFMLGPTSLKADTVMVYTAPEGTPSRVYEVFSAGSSMMLVLS